jgi:hypothetical protein
VSAKDLKAGDILVNVNGEKVVVEQVEHEILENSVKIYNFEVADNHTYLVGSENSVVVHNACKTSTINVGSKKEALEMGEKWVGNGFKEVSPGRYVSADGLKQMRIDPGHGGFPFEHINLERWNVSVNAPRDSSIVRKLLENIHLIW